MALSLSLSLSQSHLKAITDAVNEQKNKAEEGEEWVHQLLSLASSVICSSCNSLAKRALSSHYLQLWFSNFDTFQLPQFIKISLSPQEWVCSMSLNSCHISTEGTVYGTLLSLQTGTEVCRWLQVRILVDYWSLLSGCGHRVSLMRTATTKPTVSTRECVYGGMGVWVYGRTGE